MKKNLFALAFILLCSTAAFAQKYRAHLKTEYGTVTISLSDKTPKHRDNFVKLAKEHFYDSTLFHRVIPGFMIQGGDPDSKQAKAGAMLGSGTVGYRVDAEFNKELIHQRGALAAARDNNPEKASSGCQFYIVDGKKFTEAEIDNIGKSNKQNYTAAQKKIYETEGGSPHLDGNYTVFGHVTKGMDIVDKIAAQKRDRMDRPEEDQRILKLRVQKKVLFFWM